MRKNGKIKDCSKNIAAAVWKLFETSDNVRNITRTCILTCLSELEKSLFDLEKADFIKRKKY